MRKLLAIVTIACTCLLARPAAAAPVKYDLSLELRTPIYNSLPGNGWGGFRTPHGEFAGNLKLFNLLPGNAVLWVKGERTFQQSGLFYKENELQTGVDIPVTRNLTVFSYFDRRVNVDVSRVFVGFRLGFQGNLN